MYLTKFRGCGLDGAPVAEVPDPVIQDLLAASRGARLDMDCPPGSLPRTPGVAMFCGRHDFLALRTHLDEIRLAALTPACIPRSSDALLAAGGPSCAAAGALALEQSERFA